MVSTEQRAIKYLDRMEPAIQGQRGSDAAFKASIALTQGFGFNEESSLRLFMQHYNPRCIPPWPEKEAHHKIRDAAKINTGRPKGYLLSRNDSCGVKPKNPGPHSLALSQPTKEDCITIAQNRGLHGPGIYLAGQFGVVRKSDWFNQQVWTVGDVDGQPAAIRRLDGQPFPAYGNVSERKTHCLVSGANYHKPHGFIPDLPNVESVALFEGLPDFLVGWDQVLWESQIEAVGGDPFELGNLDQVKTQVRCLPLVMLATGARIEAEYIDWFRNKLVRIFVHNEEAGRKGALKWAASIASIADRVELFECGKVKNEPGFDFNDCYQLISGKVLP